MTLSPGTQLGSFDVSALIGVGGMGEVYRAKDTKLGREVAIKVLPEVFAKDKDRLARFEREAKLLAALNHPNIAGIHELGRDGETHFLVMELVEGAALDERLKSDAMSVEEALPLFAQIAEALENAHEQGIVHRDLKPANIKVTDDGKVKVLDFGLAKALEKQVPSESSPGGTLALDEDFAGITVEGRVLGTPAYMAPEQASGKGVDKRADIWAFGCCLFEALVGERPFAGSNATELLADIIKGEPEWNALPNETPGRIRVLLWRCLQKDPRRRLRDIGEARFELSESGSDPSGSIPALGSTVAEGGISLSRHRSMVIGALAIGLLFAGLATFVLTRPEPPAPPEPRPVRRYSINLSPDAPLGRPLGEGPRGSMALSPDGRLLVYVASTGPRQTALFLRRMDSVEDARLIEGTEQADSPFFSPDSSSIGFFAADKLKRVSLDGGPPVELCDVSPLLMGASWWKNGSIVFSVALEGLKRVPAAGGPVEDLLDASFLEAEEILFVSGARLLADGKRMLFDAATGLGLSDIRIAVLDLETREVKYLLEGAALLGYYPTGHLLYGRERTLMAAPFDPVALEITGPAVSLTEPNMVIRPPFELPGLFALSREGTFVYAPARDSDGTSAARTLVWVDLEGNEEPLNAASGPYDFVDVAPDGARAAVQFTSSDGTMPDNIWILDLNREPVTQQRLNLNSQLNMQPLWTLDSQRIVFSTLQDGSLSLSWIAANGTGSAESLYTSRLPVTPMCWSPDGESLIFQSMGVSGGRDIWMLSMNDDRAARPLLAENYDEDLSEISPDGRWIAYTSEESGRYQLHARPFPNVDDDKWLISTHNGVWHYWAPEGAPRGRELFYYGRLESDGPWGIVAVSIETEPEFVVGKAEMLFETEPYFIDVGRPFDMAPDGERFLMIKKPSEAEATDPLDSLQRTELIVVENWDEKLKRLAPVAAEE